MNILIHFYSVIVRLTHSFTYFTSYAWHKDTLLEGRVESEISILLCSPWHRAVSAWKEGHIFLIHWDFFPPYGKSAKASRGPESMSDWINLPTSSFFKSFSALLGPLLLLKSILKNLAETCIFITLWRIVIFLVFNLSLINMVYPFIYDLLLPFNTH